MLFSDCGVKLERSESWKLIDGRLSDVGDMTSLQRRQPRRSRPATFDPYGAVATGSISADDVCQHVSDDAVTPPPTRPVDNMSAATVIRRLAARDVDDTTPRRPSTDVVTRRQQIVDIDVVFRGRHRLLSTSSMSSTCSSRTLSADVEDDYDDKVDVDR